MAASRIKISARDGDTLGRGERGGWDEMRCVAYVRQGEARLCNGDSCVTCRVRVGLAGGGWGVLGWLVGAVGELALWFR
jgi:hypothetical protein